MTSLLDGQRTGQSYQLTIFSLIFVSGTNILEPKTEKEDQGVSTNMNYHQIQYSDPPLFLVVQKHKKYEKTFAINSREYAHFVGKYSNGVLRFMSLAGGTLDLKPTELPPPSLVSGDFKVYKKSDLIQASKQLSLL